MQKRSEKTRARLLDAAQKQFAAKGYEAASVDDICAAADVSKGAFYHHFESKQGLFLALLNGWLQQIDRGIAALRKPSVPLTLLALTEILPEVLTTASHQLPMFLEFWLRASRDKKVWRASIKPYKHFREYFAGLVAEGTAEGSLKNVDADLVGQIILSMAVGILLQALLEPRGTDWQKTARQGMQLIMEGVAK